MEKLKNILTTEPALVRGFLLTLGLFLTQFGFEWANEESMTLTADMLLSLFPLIASIMIRPSVTPNIRVGAENVGAEHDSNFESGEAAPMEEGTPVDVVAKVEEEYVGRHRS